MGLVPGALVAAGRGGSGAGGRTIGPRAARFSPEDHHGGDACIGYLAFNGEFLTANAAPAAGDAILSAGWWCLPAAGWERSGPHAPRPVEQRHPDPPPTASFPGQAVPTDELHPCGIAYVEAEGAYWLPVSGSSGSFGFVYYQVLEEERLVLIVAYTWWRLGDLRG